VWGIPLLCGKLITVTESRLDRLIDEMKEYWDWLENERDRVRAALNALGVPVGDTTSTSEAALAVFRSRPTEVLTAAEVTAYMEQAGWTTGSKDKINVVRTALARLATEGKLQRADGRGRYQSTPVAFSDGSPVRADNESQDSDEDPWESAPPVERSGGGGFSDEPPF
jgi:hypothetical protein